MEAETEAKEAESDPINQEEGDSEAELGKSPRRSKSSVHLGSYTQDIAQVIDSESTSCFRRNLLIILTSNAFDYVMGLVILFNMVIMIIETDKSAMEHDDEESSTGMSWTEVCGWVMLGIFVTELTVRLIAFRSIFWQDKWNVGDFIIVVVDASFSLVGIVVGDAFPVSILRIFRLAKLARMSKVLRVFPELRVLLAGLVGSTRAIFWGMVLLVFVLIVWSMVAVLFIHPLAKDIEFSGCPRCPHAYSSVMRASLTFWQQIVAGDSWGQATMPVIETYPATTIFFIPMFMTLGMAVMNLILGVVVNVALSAKDSIEEEDNTEKKLCKMENHTHLLDLCYQMDTEHTGNLSRAEVFQEFSEPGEFRDAILSMDVTEEDFNIIWTVVDADKKGSVPYKELVHRLYSIRSSDSEFMLAYIKYYITLIRTDLLDTLQHLESKVENEMHKIEENQHAMEAEIHKVEEHQDFAIRDTFNDKVEIVGPWQALDEQHPAACNDQGNKGEQRTSQMSNKHCSAESDRTGAWDKQISNDIKLMKVELTTMLTGMNRSLESQASLVSCLNQKMSTGAMISSAQGISAISRSPQSDEKKCETITTI